MRKQMNDNTAIEGVFFDLDGTLLDTSGDFIAIVNQMLSDDGLDPVASSLIKDHVSEGSRKLVQLAYQIEPEHPEVEPLRNRLLQYYDSHISKTDRADPAYLYTGITALLNHLEKKGIAWGVVTNKPAAYAEPLLTQVALHGRYQALICPDHVKKTKPDPESLFLACQQTGTNPDNCIYIGDHLRDIEAGNNAGMTTITARYGFIKANDLPKHWPADHSVDSAEDILPLLEKLEWQLPRRDLDV
jgi:phosphoglycolate phosphatase